jgi:hypothetical protein
VASTALLQRMERLRQEIALMKDELLTDEERVGLDFIRNDEDLELAIKFQLEVYEDGDGCPCRSPLVARAQRAEQSHHENPFHLPEPEEGKEA